MTRRNDLELVAAGAILADPPLPSQLMVWHPEQVAAAEAWDAAAAWKAGKPHRGSCLAGTATGDRGAVYETGPDGVLVGFYDFSGHAHPAEAFPYMAFGTYRPLAKPLPLSVLREDPALGPLFSGRLRARRIPETVGTGLVALVGAEVPPVAWMHAELSTSPDDYRWTLDPDRRRWMSEQELQLAVASNRKLLKQFGIAGHAAVEVRSAGREWRYDLVSMRDHVVVEFKLRADSTSVTQLRRYLDALQVERGGDWRGHLVFGTSASRLLRFARLDGRIELWDCRPRRGSVALARAR